MHSQNILFEDLAGNEAGDMEYRKRNTKRKRNTNRTRNQSLGSYKVLDMADGSMSVVGGQMMPDRTPRNNSSMLPAVDSVRYPGDTGYARTIDHAEPLLNFVSASKKQMRDAIGNVQPKAKKFLDIQSVQQDSLD